ncbi:MAG: hypothetical protein MHMPM18_002528 [Marteilia pararefringens]
MVTPQNRRGAAFSLNSSSSDDNNRDSKSTEAMDQSLAEFQPEFDFDQLRNLRDEIMRATPQFVGQKWTVITKNWFERFIQFLMDENHHAQHPGKICFKDLILESPVDIIKLLPDFSSSYNNKYSIKTGQKFITSNVLKPELQEDVDFYLIPLQLFSELKKIFGLESDEKNLIICEVVERIDRSSLNKKQIDEKNIKLFVDIYLIIIICFTLDLKVIQVAISMKQNISEIIKICRRDLEIDINTKIRPFCYFRQSDELKQLSELDESIDYYGIRNFDAILIDEFSDGEWRYEKFIDFKTQNCGLKIFEPFANFLDYIGLSKVFSQNITKTQSSRHMMPIQHQEQNDETKVRTSPVLCGLYNLGNTCYMNSALQSIFAIRELVEYFLIDKSYIKDINLNNPLSSNGEVANSFYKLLIELHECKKYTDAISPKSFKYITSVHLPQFQGYSQHDSQEFLIYLLDILHEDLNKVQNKPYYSQGVYESLYVSKNSNSSVEVIPTVNELANESWRRYEQRNQSKIVDLFHGMLKSRLTCCNPMCNNVSNVFDPMICLSLPVPHLQKSLEISIYYFDFSKRSSSTNCLQKFIVKSNQINVRNSIYESLGLNHLQIDIFVHSLSQNSLQILLNDSRNLMENCNLFVFRKNVLQQNSFDKELNENHLLHSIQVEDYRQLFHNMNSSIDNYSSKNIPFIIYLSLTDKMNREEDDDSDEKINESELKQKLCAYFHKLNPLININELEFDIFIRDQNLAVHQLKENEMDSKKYLIKQVKNIFYRLKTNEHESIIDLKQINFEMIQTSKESSNDSTINIYDCLQLFVNEEQLQSNNLWYCSKCKNHVGAYKKIDIWRLPKILIIHFKRFRYNYINRSKINTFIDFPIQELDLKDFTVNSAANNPHSDFQKTTKYKLLSIINHFGSLSGGHYTATVYNEVLGKWFECNDSNLYRINSRDPQKSNAYILIYRQKE